MIENQFNVPGSNNNIYITQITKVIYIDSSGKEIKQVEQKPHKKPFWERVKAFCAGCGSVFDFIKKLFLTITFILSTF